MRVFALLVVVIIVAACDPVYAADLTIKDSRFCGEPKRDKSGRIIRSQKVLEEFERRYPLPAHLKRSDFQINHPVPLVCGGCDTIENLIWMHKKAKTCADDWCQDRHEQLTMCVQSYRLN